MASGRPRRLGSCCCSIEAKAQLRSTTSVVGSALLRPSWSASGCPAAASKCSHRPARASWCRLGWRISAMKSREAARTEMPAALRREVRLLGDVLGQVLAEYAGAELLDDVEQRRRTVIAARESDEDESEAARLVASWSIERAEQVARAFTCYFQLVN